MYIRKRKAFCELVELLRKIEDNLEDIDAVRQINEKLLALLTSAETAIARHGEAKKTLTRQLKTQRLPKAETQKIRSKIKRVDSYIKAQRDQVFVWKSIGDALAFVYLDPFAIKHMYFDTDDYEIRQDAGALYGKEGLEAELQVLNSALDHDVPAILCDLTNVLRFGDICLLGNSDPFPIEVKSSSRLNQRGLRQIAKLEKLHDFLETDNAEDFRGFSGQTKRIASSTLYYHRDAVNDAINNALVNGHAVVTPEDGLHFLVMRTDSYSNEIFSELDLEAAEVFDLNHFKNGHAWAPYLPFILSIRKPDHILDFLEGRVYIVAVIAGQKLVSRFEAPDREVRYRPDEQYSIQCLDNKTCAFFGVSSHFIARAAFEFLSLESIVSTQSPMTDHLAEGWSEYGQPTDPDEFRQRLCAVFGADDEWVERILQLSSPATKSSEPL